MRSKYPPLYPYPGTKPRRSGCGLWLLLIGVLVCIGLTYFPSAFMNGPQVIPWMVAHIGTPGAPSQAQAASINTSAVNGSLVGGPSLSPDFINEVLALAHSPASGTGQQLYDLSTQYGIDDAYALAFFREESRYGTTGEARLTRSLGNIRCSAGYVCQGGYRAYDSYAAGYADWYHLISVLYIQQWHLTTVQTIIPVYAPSGDGNNPPAYIKAVLQAVSLWRAGNVQV